MWRSDDLTNGSRKAAALQYRTPHEGNGNPGLRRMIAAQECTARANSCIVQAVARQNSRFDKCEKCGALFRSHAQNDRQVTALGLPVPVLADKRATT